jgi:hypothetical protein
MKLSKKRGKSVMPGKLIMNLFRDFPGSLRHRIPLSVFIIALGLSTCYAQGSSQENSSFEMPDDNFLNNPSGQKFHDWRNLPHDLGTASSWEAVMENGGLPVGEWRVSNILMNKISHSTCFL